MASYTLVGLKKNRVTLISTCAVLIAAVGCKTTQPPPPAQTPAKAFPSTGTQSPVQTTTDHKPSLAIVDSKVVDDLFEKRNCAAINDSVKKAGDQVQGLPLLSQMFVKFCASEFEPKNIQKLNEAIAMINEVEARYDQTGVISIARLAELRGQRYLAADDKDNAIKNLTRSRDLLMDAPVAARTLDAQLLDLYAATNALTPQERTKMRDAMQLAIKDDKLFEALSMADSLLTETKSKEARSIIYDNRNRILARIELLFALDMSLMEGFKGRGQDMEARELASNMKKKFPQKNYEMRIDGIIATAPLAPGAAPSTTPSVASTMLDDNLNDMQKVDRVLSEGRAALDAGEAQKAVEIVDSLPVNLQTDKTKRLRAEAMEVHVRDLRAHVRALYTRAQSQSTKPAKIEVLKQAKQTLESILTKYPTTTVKVAVERNLKSVNDEINDLGKSK